MSNNPKLSICCITFNQADFIRKTLDGFMMQKTNFPFEVIIHDDVSTDGTVEIIKEFEKKYPDIIKPIYQKENQWSQGINVLKNVFAKVRGEYVAICEGDDYWLDENKLQKQVDFLDCHPDFSISFHPVKVIWSENLHPESIFPTPKTRYNKKVLTLDDLLKNNFIQTNSVVYRWRLKSEYNDNTDSLDMLPDNILPIDWYVHILHAQVGKIGFFDEVMAVYFKHAAGVWFEAGKTPDFYQKAGLKMLNFYTNLGRQANRDFSDKIDTIFQNTFNSCILKKDFTMLSKVASEYPILYEKKVKSIIMPKSFNSKIFKYMILSKISFGKKRQKYKNRLDELITKKNSGLT